MKLNYKLDMLQGMAIACEGNLAKEYLIGVLAEHADEEEMTAKFLEWVVELLKG